MVIMSVLYMNLSSHLDTERHATCKGTKDSVGLMVLCLFSLSCVSTFTVKDIGWWWRLNFYKLCCLWGVWLWFTDDGWECSPEYGPGTPRLLRMLKKGSGTFALHLMLEVGGRWQLLTILCQATAAVWRGFITRPDGIMEEFVENVVPMVTAAILSSVMKYKWHQSAMVSFLEAQRVPRAAAPRPDSPCTARR